MNSLALLVQEAFTRDPHGGDLYVFRGKSGKLIKILWHDGPGMSLYAKRLERGRFLWPSSADGVVTITPAQLGYLLATGGCRNIPGDRRRPADRWDLNRWHDQRFGQRPGLVILWSPARRPLPEHLPRQRIVYPTPATCPCCGDSRLRKLGEDVTETLELLQHQWKVSKVPAWASASAAKRAARSARSIACSVALSAENDTASTNSKPVACNGLQDVRTAIG
ncbi:transposase [Bradyrhizobium sp. CIR48]|nr:transposase [Bradyrhizobium sp. CIR18]MBB4422802.1 transposase [Bradyrhizobium sp. CIR48]